MKLWIKERIPKAAWLKTRRLKHGSILRFRAALEKTGMMVSQRKDYYSPLPSELSLRRTRERWMRPSSLKGISYELPALQQGFQSLCHQFLQEFLALPAYEVLAQKGFGPGFPQVDAFTLYGMVRSLKPARYLEIGSGLSTYYCQLAREQNLRENQPLEMTCVEPFPYVALKELAHIRLLQSEVQDVPATIFETLQANDILFIDSSHILRIDGDVPFLFLEILPLLARGVYVHIHDIPFPFNVPYPPEYWTLLEHAESPHWPMYWNEAMLVQAFLAFNEHFKIIHSTPLLRFHDEKFLSSLLPFYQPVSKQPNTFSSLWLHKIR